MKKKSILAILGATTLFSGAAIAATPNITATASPNQQNVRLLTSNSTTKIVTANGLSVRAKASTSASRLGILTKGAKVTVVGQDGNWSKIMFNGKTAYVASSYLGNTTTSTPTTTTNSSVQGTTKIVTSNGLNVRAKNTTSSSKLGVLAKGAKVTVVGQDGDWSKIMFNGKTAYVASSYLGNAATSAPTTNSSVQGTTKVVTSNGLNVRVKASSGSSRIGILAKGAKVTVVGQDGNWSKIMFNGKTAYVASSYLGNTATSASTTTTNSSAQGTTKVVTTNGLNVRAKNTTSSSKLGVLAKGAKITVVGQDGDWSKIMFNGKTAYVASSYLGNTATSAPTTTTNSSTQGTTKVVTTNGLNVRAKASTTASKLGILAKGAKVTVVGQDGSWSKIIFNGKTAFVSTQYLK